MIPKIIHYCWFGGAEMPGAYQEYITEWKQYHPEWKFILWDETNLDFDNDYLLKARETGNWSNISNYVRLKALYSTGGVYLDTDIKLIKPLDDLLIHECFTGFESGNIEDTEFSVNSAICGSVPAHHLIEKCLNNITRLFDGSEQSNLSGPVLLTNTLKDYHGLVSYQEQVIDGIKIFEKEVFYPLPFDKAHDSSNFGKYITPSTVAIHVWGRSWYSKDVLIDRIDNQTIFIEDQLNYIKILESRVNSQQNLSKEEGGIYLSSYRSIDKIDKATDSIAFILKNQEYLLYNLNNRLNSMESNYIAGSEEKKYSTIYDFLLNKLVELESKVSDLKVEQKVHEKAVAMDLAASCKAVDNLTVAITEMANTKDTLQRSIQNIKLESEEVFQGYYHTVTESQREFKKEILALINSTLLSSSASLETEKVESRPINEYVIENNFVVENSSKDMAAQHSIEPKGTFSIDQEVEFKSLEAENALLLKEKHDLISMIKTYQADAELKSEENSRLKFKVNSLTAYIDSFGHVRNEFEQRIQLLENLIQKMRLKNRAKRLVGLYKQSN